MLFTYKEATNRRTNIRDLENGWYRIIPITEHRWLSEKHPSVQYLYKGWTTWGDSIGFCWVDEDADCRPWLYSEDQPHSHMNGYGRKFLDEVIDCGWPEYVTVLEKLS